MNTPLNLYVFRGGPFAPDGNTMVCVGERGGVEAHLGYGQVQTLFRGAAVYTDEATKQDYLGVWGSRNASRMRRLLREHGAELVIHSGAPPGARLRHWTTYGKGTNPHTL